MYNKINIAITLLLSMFIVLGSACISISQEARYKLKEVEEREQGESLIDWIMDYDEAREVSIERGKPMFILITAPSWCSPCQRMEEEVFSEVEIANYLNDKFIPVKIVDEIEGERNPDLERFDFPGFPTMFIHDTEGKEQDKVIGYVDPSYFYGFLYRYINPDIETDKPTSTDEPSYPESVQKALKDGQFALRWLVSLYKSEEYQMCAEIASLIINKADPNDIQMYYEDMLYMLYISQIHLRDFDYAMEVSEDYIKSYQTGKFIESVLYLRILMLYHFFDREKAQSEARYFLEVYPESRFADKIRKLFS